VRCPFLDWHPAANSKLVWTKGHDKLGVGVTEESHKKLWYKFPMGGQGHSKHREGQVDRDKEQGSGTGRERVSKSVSTVSGGNKVWPVIEGKIQLLVISLGGLRVNCQSCIIPKQA
jgi:hypothetical protein